nr:antibiotic biosynthesis monooxygenase [Endozoicomonas sp. OPT23]
MEVAVLDVKNGQKANFERSFYKASRIISSMEGYVSHELQKCIEKSDRYMLLINWQTLENHTEDFRQSAEYQQWKDLLHHFYEPFPKVEHYQPVVFDKL